MIALGLICYLAGLRINTTKSIPVGIYRLTDVPVGKGEYVIFYSPADRAVRRGAQRGYIGAGFCPGYGYTIKCVLGVEGDVVSSGDEGIGVNGKLLLASAPKEADSAGRVLPRYPFSDYTLKESELLLMSDVSGTSFDGHYFGPMNLSQIEGVVTPIILL